ncbi:MAG: cardiolipin synthase, partial [Acholeplasmataceae bacterium]|nr:cardiolipin synthase [Acholeplasmataceae bacterium]
MLTFFKKFFKLIMSRGFIISFLLLLQLSFFFFIAWELGRRGIYIYALFAVLSVVFAVSILNRSMNPAYKISWLLVVLVIPFAGPIFYLMFGKRYFSKKRIKKLQKLHQDTVHQLKRNYREIDIENPDVAKTSHYITRVTGLPGWENTTSDFLTPGETFFEVFLEELKKAKKFIFLEYFILQDGYMWQSILEVLEQKVQDGVDVRLLYDDFANVNRVGVFFKKDLIKKGLKVINFNPYRPRLSMVINYRDHRKITVIDGNVGFVGGINLADEYINRTHKFGYWKDASIILRGAAVWNLTFLFLEMWQSSSDEVFDYDLYYPTETYPTDGFVQPFGDGPHDAHQSIEMVYMQIINNAKRYVYITTPYLIIDHEIATALKLAALSGVDVRIMMPHIPDKKLIYMVSKSYYPELLKAGVKIYEYLPGFLHSKMIVSDDEVAMIGTANLDYRSFYLHFEVSCYLYRTSSIMQMREDAIKCL